MIAKKKRKARSTSPFVLKTAGGAASQCLGLMTGIFIAKQIDRPFLVRHFPFSTGGYYPLAITPLLASEEILDAAVATRGLSLDESLEVGSIIENHPLLKQGFTYEKFLGTLRKLHLETLGKRLRNEFYVNYSAARLNAVPVSIKAVSGGFFPFVDTYVNEEMHARFVRGGIRSPFSPQNEELRHNRVVIHYRIGDKRTTYSHPGIMGDGIADPRSFQKILEDENLLRDHEILVVSDEPEEAQRLLLGVGIRAAKSPVGGSLWDDLFLMSTASVVICPWSTVSQFALTFLVAQDRKVFYPISTSRGWGGKWQLSGVRFYEANYLPKGHPIYQQSYSSSSKSDLIYDNVNDHSKP